MRSISYLPQLLTVVVISTAAVAQTPFPFNRQFVAVSMNGQDYTTKSPTLTIKASTNGDALRGTGFAGCNKWSSRIVLREGQISLGQLGTTRMFCADQMAAESNFLDALKSVTHWRMEGSMLVLEGGRTKLLMALAEPNKP